jgi:hypothetical protein
VVTLRQRHTLNGDLIDVWTTLIAWKGTSKTTKALSSWRFSYSQRKRILLFFPFDTWQANYSCEQMQIAERDARHAMELMNQIGELQKAIEHMSQQINMRQAAPGDEENTASGWHEGHAEHFDEPEGASNIPAGVSDLARRHHWTQHRSEK